jgi:hypothetical protein
VPNVWQKIGIMVKNKSRDIFFGEDFTDIKFQIFLSPLDFWVSPKWEINLPIFFMGSKYYGKKSSTCHKSFSNILSHKKIKTTKAGTYFFGKISQI